MNLRKIFNLPTVAQIVILNEEEKKIIERCLKISNIEQKEQEENKKIRDGICPICKNKTIVNKIRHVQGKGTIKGNVRFGFGTITGAVLVDTESVNYCNNCENEWKKYKTKPISYTSILKIALNYLGQIFRNPDEKKQWKLDTIESIFDNCSAEIIYSLCKKHKSLLYDYTHKKLTLFRLRKYFKSIYDSPEKQKNIKKL